MQVGRAMLVLRCATMMFIAWSSPIDLDTPILLTSSTTGDSSFNFGAQYYRLSSSPVNPGSVRATAVFMMIYQ